MYDTRPDLGEYTPALGVIPVRHHAVFDSSFKKINRNINKWLGKIYTEVFTF